MVLKHIKNRNIPYQNFKKVEKKCRKVPGFAEKVPGFAEKVPEIN